MDEPPVVRPQSPNNAQASRFHAHAQGAEDILKEQTIGLVHLSDFRKRRAEALEQTARGSPGISSGGNTPDSREAEPEAIFKKRRKGGKGVKKGALSFHHDEEDESTSRDGSLKPHTVNTSRATSASGTESEEPFVKKRLKPSSTVGFQPKAMTKSVLSREAEMKEQLRKEYLQLQEAVKQTEFAVPFCFFDGRNAPGGTCRMKKGDQIWLFLERARKLGADLAGKGDKSKKDWARISVDDLMLVRGDLIIPHHYEFYYFIVNRTQGYHGVLFNYSSEPTAATPAELLAKPDTPKQEATHLMTSAQLKQKAAEALIPETELEGFGTDASATRVVDRRWYERNKHIYPASTWEDFEPGRDYTKGGRKDAQGNAFFFSG